MPSGNDRLVFNRAITEPGYVPLCVEGCIDTWKRHGHRTSGSAVAYQDVAVELKEGRRQERCCAASPPREPTTMRIG